MDCPRCKVNMEVNTYEGVEIDRCHKCNGTWLDATEITKIIDIRDELFSKELIKETLSTATNIVSDADKKKAINCPKCSETMSITNYNLSSGIIIDRCKNSHGIWLDQMELEKIQIHMEHWDKVYEEKKEEWISLLKEINERNNNNQDEIRRTGLSRRKYIFDLIISFIFRSLR